MLSRSLFKYLNFSKSPLIYCVERITYQGNFINPEEVVTRSLDNEVTFEQPFSIFILSKYTIRFLFLIQDFGHWKSIIFV